jgi:hypothetical protein
VGSRAVLDAVVKRKIPSPRRKSSPDNPIVQPVASCYTDKGTPALKYHKYKVFEKLRIHQELEKMD